MSPGIIALVVVAVAVLLFGGYRAMTDGRFRGTHRVTGATEVHADADEVSGPLDGTEWAAQLGERWTLVQFSSAFCAPCRVARRVLADVAGSVPGVAHVEIDAEHHLDVVRRLGVLRTPTTLVLDAEGHEIGRASGAPTKAQVLATLDEHLEI